MGATAVLLHELHRLADAYATILSWRAMVLQRLMLELMLLGLSELDSAHGVSELLVRATSTLFRMSHDSAIIIVIKCSSRSQTHRCSCELWSRLHIHRLEVLLMLLWRLLLFVRMLRALLALFRLHCLFLSLLLTTRFGWWLMLAGLLLLWLMGLVVL